jgi:hypothetical protein
MAWRHVGPFTAFCTTNHPFWHISWTDVTGPANATTAILSVYDIFGFYPQTIQGADILAHGDKEHQYQVFMPDFFEGKPADMAWWSPPDSKEKGEKIGQWFQSAAPPKHLPHVPAIVRAAQEVNSVVRSWGVIGYCWGGQGGFPDCKWWQRSLKPLCKLRLPWSASDAEKVVIPVMILASKDEPKEDVSKYQAVLKVPKHVEMFEDQVHGFISARGDLDDDKSKTRVQACVEVLP